MPDAVTQLLHDGTVHAPALPPRKSRVRVTVGVLGIVACLAVIAAATLSPTPIDMGYEAVIEKALNALHRIGVPEWFGYRSLEFTANMAMFFPLGLLLGLALGRFLWLGIVLLPLLSAVLEGAQALLLQARYATVQDVIANSLGGWAGLAVAGVLIALVHARDRRVVADARAGRRVRHDPVRIGLALLVLAGVTVVILLITLRPTAVTEGRADAIETVLNATHAAGVSQAFDYHALEFVANILMFVPFGFFAALVFPRRHVWASVIVVAALSAGVEVCQAVFLPGRTASWADVLANGVGGVLGVLIAAGLRAVVHTRDRLVVPRAIAAGTVR